MATSWFGSARSFHVSCLNALARCLALSPHVSAEKVKKLLSLCPRVEKATGGTVTALDDRSLNAVLSLGLFAVESKLQSCGDEVVEYLLALFHSLPSAHWTQSVGTAARKSGLIAEQFCFKLGLIILAVSQYHSKTRDKVVKAFLEVFRAFAEEAVNADSNVSERLCLVILPALIGLSRAFQGSARSRRKLFASLYSAPLDGPSSTSADDDEGDTVFEVQWKAADVEEFYDTMTQVLQSDCLFLAESTSEKLHFQDHPYRCCVPILQYCFLSLLRDTLSSCSSKDLGSFENSLLSFLRQKIKDGTRNLRTSAGSLTHSDRAFFTVKGMSVAVQVMVWAARKMNEAETCFQELSNLLSVNTTQNVLVSPLRAAILEGIATLAETFPSLTNGALSRVKELLMSKTLQTMYREAQSSGNLDPLQRTSVIESGLEMVPSHVSRVDAYWTVQNALGRAVCRTLRAGSLLSSECVVAFLTSLGNRLYQTNAEDENALRVAEGIVLLLGHVASEFGEEHGAISCVVALFQQRLFTPVSNLDGRMVVELGKIAASLGDQSTLDFLSHLMSISLGGTVSSYSKLQSGIRSYSHIYQPVMNSLTHVASHLDNDGKRRDLLMKTLQIFVQQGIEAHRASERNEAQFSHKATSSSFSLGLLLPLIAKLVEKMDSISNPSQKDVRLFRDFWLYCIVMGFAEADRGIFPSSWYHYVRSIAAKSPQLLSMGAEQFLEKELELNHPLKIGNTSGELQEIRQSLIDKLGKSAELDRLVFRLTFVQCTYLHSIWKLESLRLECDTKFFPYIFKYLEDKGLQKELWVAVEMIANQLMQQLLISLEAKTADRARNEELVSHAQLLIFKFCHLRGRIKQLADRYLIKLTDKFPHLLWSKPVIHAMLDLLQELSLSFNAMEPSERQTAQAKVPYLPYVVTLPDNSQRREKTVNYFALRCEQILDFAVKLAPNEMRNILEDYVQRMGCAVVGLEHHSGVALAIAQLTRHFQISDKFKDTPAALVEVRHRCLKDSVSNSASSYHLQSYYSGAVKAVRSLLDSQAKDSKAVSQKLSSMYTEELKEALAKNSRREELTAVLYKLTACIIITEGSDRSLLFAVAQLPVKTFDELTISIAVQCWHWLLTARPDLEHSFMTEFAAVWKWTINERMGIFTRRCPRAQSWREKPSPIPVNQHLLLIKFLSDRLEVIGSKDFSLVMLMCQLVHQSLTLGVGPDSIQPQHFSSSLEAACARFNLLTLGVSILRGKLVKNIVERTLLRERIYNAALDFFCSNPMWPADDTASVRRTVTALIKFWISLRDLKNTVPISVNSLPELESRSSIPRTTSFWQALSSESTSLQGSWLNTLTSSKRSSFSTLQIPVTAALSKRSSTATKKNVLLKRRNLILALLKSEIERLSVWQNPGGLAELAISGEEEVNTWVNSTVSERHWQSTVVMAYQTSPHLAFQLMNRFNNDTILREVSRLVKSDPVSFIGVPEAVQVLANKESVVLNSAELYHLLYWRNVSPASALSFFSKPFSENEITSQYANKAMQRFEPDEILLYIPQLVQALRYDKLGFSKAYILSAAKKSQLLAHQFLWNMQANTYMDEEGKQKDAEIGDTLEELRQQIQDGLSGAALKFFEREFSFFKKITDISRIIRPFPKPERKEQCLQALKEITLEPGVYLPSNPDSLVLEIDYKSGRPMQSAAKAPFLAKFKVRKCGTAEVEAMNTQDEQRPMDKGDVLTQGCIFKVGDDVRQDILALQIIQLFKDVFTGAGLSLYLVPYRVIATNSGCGVIECVPDSKSRDQLGKETQVSLKEYFVWLYGDEETISYQKARMNFIRSMAGYSLVTYLLQIKDRHNGNIMIDKDGHVIHIDFGFLFESSPGGNIGFEPDLKLTDEMLDVIGGKKSESYKWFLDLCVLGYLVIRPFREQVVSLVSLMLDTGFPCFRGNTIEELRARFKPQLSDKDAAKAIVEVVESSCLNLRTYSYDVIQDVQQKIYYHK